jgi:hypothetical protein
MDTDREKPKYVEKPFMTASFSTEYPIWTNLGLNFRPPKDESNMFLQQTTWRWNQQHYHIK